MLERTSGDMVVMELPDKIILSKSVNLMSVSCVRVRGMVVKRLNERMRVVRRVRITICVGRVLRRLLCKWRVWSLGGGEVL